MNLQAIKYTRGALEILDQLKLPLESVYVHVRDTEEGWSVIRNMQVCLYVYVLHSVCECVHVCMLLCAFTEARRRRQCEGMIYCLVVLEIGVMWCGVM